MIALRVTIVLTGCLLQGAAVEDGVNPESSGELSIDRELLIRERYEEILAKNPFHESVFDKVYESYLGTESVAAWTRKLEAVEPSVENGFASLVLLARIHQRQFDSSKAVELLERASTLGADSPELRLLLGTIYYHSGNDTRAIDLLSASLDALTDPEKRARATRTLGALHLRQGNREEAVATWRRLAEQNPTDIFARLELAEILEDHRMWDEAIGAYREVVALSPDDPYRRCAGLRSIGRCHVQLEKYHDAIATYEEALELVAPGNWLFEDLKLRLVSVYEDLGELDGLAEYLKGRMDGSASDVDFSDLLAETYVRMGEVDEAEAEYRRMLERDPRRAGTYEKLIDLYSRTWQREKTIETHEKLVELFPNEPDYLRRLGEAHLRYGARDKAEEAWERLVADEPTPQRLAQLAQWFDKYGFPAEAIASYDRALADLPNRQWLFDLAELKYAEGHEEEAVALWLSSIHETDSSASECAEVASILEAHGIFDQAEVLLRKAIDEAPDDLNWQLALARNLTQQGRHSDALPYFEQLAAQAENSYFQDQGERGLIDVHAATGELEKKLQEWKELADANRDSTQVLMKCARLFAHTGDRDKTLELYQRCAELEPDNPACLRALAEVCRRARQTEQAIELYTRLLELDKPRAGAYLRELLRVYRSARMKDDAVSTAERIVELGPADPEARATLAKVYMENGDADQALQQYRRTLRLRPRDPSYLLQYGEILAGQSQWGDAKETFRRMLEAADDEQTRLTAATHLARICQQQGRLEELVEEFRTRIRHTPHKLSAYQELAAIYRQSPEPARAIEVLESGLSSVQDRRALLRELVRESYNFEDYEKVVTYYRQLLSLSGEPTVYEYERLAKVYAQMGDIDNARQMWTQIAESASDDPYVFTRLAGLMRPGLRRGILRTDNPGARA